MLPFCSGRAVMVGGMMLTGGAMAFCGADLIADPSGALVWPARGWLVVADLHLEKGSGFAARGTMLPPYDTMATLARVEALVERWQPRRVVCLGDSFHDPRAPQRMAGADGARIAALTRRCDWVWIIGNHDPAPPVDWGGTVAAELVEDRLLFRHAADPAGVPAGMGEVSGHYHPKASVPTRGRRIGGRCFVADGRRLILPAFGAYAGGLDVRDPAVAGLLDRPFTVWLMGRDRVHRFPSHALTRAA